MDILRTDGAMVLDARLQVVKLYTKREAGPGKPGF